MCACCIYKCVSLSFSLSLPVSFLSTSQACQPMVLVLLLLSLVLLVFSLTNF